MRNSVLRDKVLIASVLVYLAFVGSVWALHLHATIPNLKATVFDQIARPNERVQIAAKLEIDGPGPFKPDFTGLSVEFLSESAVLGTSTTADDGMAMLEVAAPAGPGAMMLRVEPADRARYRVEPAAIDAALFVEEEKAPIIVCDIDGTITAGNEWDALTRSMGPEALPGAADVLTRLAQTHALLFLTARDEGLLNRTREWLSRKGFPRRPVLCRDWELGSLTKTGEFKRQVLAELKLRFPNLLWGIGNSSGDCEAYRAAGMPHLTLEKSRCEAKDGAPRCIPVKDWTALQSVLDKELGGK